MNFYVGKGRYKSSSFDLFLRTSNKEEIKKHCPDKPNKTRLDIRVPKEDWEKYGFYTNMTLEQAKSRSKQLNNKKKLEKAANARTAINKKIKEELEIESALLPSYLTEEYVEKLRKDFYGTKKEFLKSKQLSYWRLTAKVIREVGIENNEWADEKRSFYKHFIKMTYAPSTVQKIITEMNKWGKFCARKTKEYFEPLPKPRGRDLSLIVDAYADSSKRKKESKPLYHKQLVKHEDSFKPEQFNWLFISVWFGLRPQEVDNLKKEDKGKFWKITKKGNYKVLNIFQTKINAVERDKRWKFIPCLYPEQIEALEMIKSGEFKRPIGKTMQRRFGEGYTPYAGRKGFEKQMEQKGIAFEFISAWLGHQNVDRTWKSYKDKKSVSIPKDF